MARTPYLSKLKEGVTWLVRRSLGEGGSVGGESGFSASLLAPIPQALTRTRFSEIAAPRKPPNTGFTTPRMIPAADGGIARATKIAP